MELKKGDMVEILNVPLLLEMYYNIGDTCEVLNGYKDFAHIYTSNKKNFFGFEYEWVKLIEPTIETQKKQVFKHLQENSITSWEAISKYRITRLADVIYRLRKDHNITTEIVKENKKQWAKYTLIK